MSKAVGDMIQVEQIEMVLAFKYPGEDVVRMMCSAGGKDLARHLQVNWGANMRLFQEAATSSSKKRNISDVVSFLKGLKKDGLNSLFKKVFLEEGNTNNISSNNPFHLKHGWNAAFQRERSCNKGTITNHCLTGSLPELRQTCSRMRNGRALCPFHGRNL